MTDFRELVTFNGNEAIVDFQYFEYAFKRILIEGKGSREMLDALATRKKEATVYLIHLLTAEKRVVRFKPIRSALLYMLHKEARSVAQVWWHGLIKDTIDGIPNKERYNVRVNNTLVELYHSVNVDDLSLTGDVVVKVKNKPPKPKPKPSKHSRYKKPNAW